MRKGCARAGAVRAGSVLPAPVWVGHAEIAVGGRGERVPAVVAAEDGAHQGRADRVADPERELPRRAQAAVIVRGTSIRTLSLPEEIWHGDLRAVS